MMCANEISALYVCVHVGIAAEMSDLELFSSYMHILKAVLTLVYMTCH
jgi:hypothetical protein